MRQQILRVEGVLDVLVTAADGTAVVTCRDSVDPADVAAAVRGDFRAALRD